MRKDDKAAAFVALIVTATVASAGVRAADEPEADEQLAVRMSPTIVLERQDVRAFVTVPRQPGNRRLLVTLEGPSYFTSTERQLNGDAAARMHEFAFRQLPEGQYSVRVLVVRARGADSGAETTFTVRGARPPLDVAGPRQQPDGW